MKRTELQTILIVDDDFLGIQVLASQLSPYYRVLIAKSGTQVWSRLAKNKVDLILLDVLMPDMDGYTVCKILKDDPKTASIPVMFITAMNEDKDEARGLDLGAVDYIRKPFYLPIVHTRIRTHLDQQLLQQRLIATNSDLVRTNQDLVVAQKGVQAEKVRYENLLSSILPEVIAQELLAQKQVTPKHFELVTVMFTDFADFTRLTATVDPELLIRELNDLFCAFDNIMAKNNCERIKTIGDGYLAVCGLPIVTQDHAQRMVQAALECIAYLEIRNSQLSGKTLDIQWDVRIGIHTGPVVAGVVGLHRFAYDIFGDTVNLASRVEKQAGPQSLAMTEQTRELVKNLYPCVPLGAKDLKGKGKVHLFSVDRMQLRTHLHQPSECLEELS